ncbi:hypothetical protein [Cellvibrio polysaccharolyticus]|uniref:Uncharacterized protein n=1 Tax=Cellvibrio polysaccharolyticus TaxID=2082724 RepID=A0A928YTJ1_9GAMM|nr:hypothetical protein [Cellvibrio polysaccharolyticus]MBE8716415.1 hypothetical protein [Cellvibrio polysaccharolyticus]
MKNLKKWTVLILIIYSLPGCPLFEQRSVTQVLNNKEQYHDKEIIVSGALMITPQTIAICEKTHQKTVWTWRLRKKLLMN